MQLLSRISGWVSQAANGLNFVSCAAVVIMMLLTCGDVILRLLRHPIPGTYELVGYLGAIVVAFSLAYTSVEKGHISVELLVERFPRRLRGLVEGIGTLAGAVFFAIVSWQCLIYGKDLKASGEVSLTLEVPIYPFAYGIALGCAALTVVLIFEATDNLRKAVLSK